MTNATLAEIAEYVATEVAWRGSANEARITQILTVAGFDWEVAASEVIAFGVEAGHLQPIPRIGGYTVTRNTNSRVFGEGFADWMSAR